jgi:hypothetical protein
VAWNAGRDRESGTEWVRTWTQIRVGVRITVRVRVSGDATGGLQIGDGGLQAADLLLEGRDGGRTLGAGLLSGLHREHPAILLVF